MATSTTHTKNHRGKEVQLQGVPICPGIGISYAHAVDSVIHVPKNKIELSQVSSEQGRYTRAVEVTQDQLHNHVVSSHEGSTLSNKAILDVHQAILADKSFHNRVRKRIAAECKNAEWCLKEEGHGLITEFDKMRNPYFQARGEDIRDMVGNILAVLTSANGPESFSEPAIGNAQVLVSRHFYPSSVMLAYRKHAAGFASESNALSSHAAILLKGFGIPSVGGVQNLIVTVRDGDQIIVDGINGLVIVRPSPSTLDKYLSLKKEAEAPETITVPEQCFTRDGTRISLNANIENPDQISLMLSHGLEGIGLFRTEFFILVGGRIPDEEAQYKTYRYLINKAAGRSVVIRTFDIGTDKQISFSQECTGNNPSLGVRGIRRHLLGKAEELRTQLRAIIRASVGGNVGILIPMITTMDDVIEAKRHFMSIKKELHENAIEFSENVALGAMIETPAAAIAVADILSEVDFISIGTNDLLQYFMAADRDNEQVLHYNDTENSAFLWLMKFIIHQAKDLGREYDVTICGEIASQPHIIPLLLRLGYRSFSISPVAATNIRNVCVNTDLTLRK